MELYAARHGETAWNRENRICGRTDLPLTELGRRQAEELARSLAGRGIGLILTSPLLRARETAAAAAAVTGAPVRTDPRLAEQHFGSFEGRDRGEAAWQAAKRQLACRCPGGESALDVAARVYPLLEELRAAPPAPAVLLVCHGGVCRVIRSYFLDMDTETFARYSPANCQAERYLL